MENYTIDPDGNSIHIYVEGQGPGIVEWSKLLHDKGMEDEDVCVGDIELKKGHIILMDNREDNWE